MGTEEGMETFHTNGAVAERLPSQETPELPPELLTQLITKTDMMWRETQRRDGNAVWHSWQWMRGFCVLLGVWVVTVGIGLWLYAHSRDVEVMVQTVVYNAEGHFVSLGVPQKLLEYEPEDGQWRDMLEEWVHKKQWRSDEPSATLARANWAWVYKHTCGDATKRLEHDELEEKPFQVGKITRSVKVRSTTKTPTPQSFQVVWEETTVDKVKATKDKTLYTGTFLVGRYKPTSRADAERNHLGLCVTAYDIRGQSS
jgi:type IV secretory pathway TrbF-like protein